MYLPSGNKCMDLFHTHTYTQTHEALRLAPGGLSVFWQCGERVDVAGVQCRHIPRFILIAFRYEYCFSLFVACPCFDCPRVGISTASLSSLGCLLLTIMLYDAVNASVLPRMFRSHCMITKAWCEVWVLVMLFSSYW